jgi:hypothetical protein
MVKVALIEKKTETETLQVLGKILIWNLGRTVKLERERRFISLKS